MPNEEINDWPHWRDWITGRVEKHDIDFYEGEGKENPSFTVRVDRLERMQEKQAANTTLIVRLLLGAIVSALADVAMHHFH